MPDPGMEAASGRTVLLRVLLGGLLVAAAAAGVFARVQSLGTRPLAVDEYYFLKSIEAILATGIPELPTGGYYTRGLPVQYITAASLLVFDDAHFALRLPSVLLGLGTVVLAFFYGRKTLGQPWGWCLAALLLVSSWSVEFSRFGRMYAGFQFLTLAFLLALLGGMSEPEPRRRYLPHVILIAAVLTHQLAILLAPLLFLPLLLPGPIDRYGGRKGLSRYVGASIVTALGLLAVIRNPLRGVGAVDVKPVDYVPAEGSGLLDLPGFPFWSLHVDPAVNVAFVFVLLGLVAAAVIVMRCRKLDVGGAEFFGTALLIAGTFHALLLALLCAIVLTLRYGLPGRYRQHPWAAATAAAGSGAAVGWALYSLWLTYGQGSRAWIAEVGANVYRAAFLRVFVWPDPSRMILEPWSQELPVLAAMLGAALAIYVLLNARQPRSQLARSPAIVVLYMIFVAGFLHPPFVVTRYTYFLYPVILAVLLQAIKHVFRALEGGSPRRRRTAQAVAVAVAIACFGVAEDFNPAHLSNVTSAEATFRTGRFERFRNTWYNRDDFRGAAEYVSARAAGGLIVVDENPPVSYYLSREHVVYLERHGHRFGNVSRVRGTVDFWSGLRLLSTPKELRDYSDSATVVWLVRRSRGEGRFDLDEAWPSRLAEHERVFLTQGGEIEILRIRLHENGLGGTLEEPADDRGAR